MTVTTLKLSPGDTLTIAMSTTGATVSMMTAPVDVEPAPPATKPARLFAADSPWNSKPVNPVLGKDAVPAEKQKPWVEEAAWSTKIFRASATDKPMVVTVTDIANQLDGGAVTIPRFPAATMPATGQDGHCEILDGDTLHSFFQLRQAGGKWTANKYARTSALGSGFGTVANPDNVRAAGCSTAGGLLLASELGLDTVPHALAIGLDKNGMAVGPIYPATMEDQARGYTGKFPMGARLMLPATFKVDALKLPTSKAIARTLMTYGGILVDATVGTMNIYAEIGSGWNQANVDGFYPDMQAIKEALRQVVPPSGPSPHRSMNLLSMRGPWEGYNGSKAFGRYDAATDLFQAEATTEARTVRQLLYTHDEADRFGWKRQNWNLNPEPGVKYLVRAIGEGNITATLAVKRKDFKANYGSTPALGPSKSATFTWPTEPGTVTEVYVDKPAGAAASIRLELVKA
ncbi:hypothetical protein [Sphingomonas faeni]|uniref:hypothetical protein n=1 Tax=Sphingomonas faeni TaxID=185950 RepID=UPI003362F573